MFTKNTANKLMRVLATRGRIKPGPCTFLFLLLLSSIICMGQGTGYNALRSFSTAAVANDVSLPTNSVIGWHQISWIVTGAPAACTVKLQSSPDGTTWSDLIANQTCTANGQSVVTGQVLANFVRVNVTALSGGASPTITTTYVGWAYNPNGSGGNVASIASGSTAMGTSAITSGICAAVVTVGATGVATTDRITVTPNTDPTVVTGYAVSATGSLYIQAYPTTNNVNFKVCNNTSGSLTPAALTLNWSVVR